MRSNAWTTQEEYDFLTALLPKFISQRETRSIAPFLGETACDFLKRFPARSSSFDRKQMAVVRFQCF
jgi:hypothetical protein